MAGAHTVALWSVSSGQCVSRPGKDIQGMYAMIEAVTDEGFFPNDRNPSQNATAAKHTLNVSVISLGGEVLIIVPVSARSSVWELKGLIEKSVPEKHMKARWMMLMPGPQVLPDAASLHDAGVVDGTRLSVIVAPTYNLLVRTESGNIAVESGGQA